MSNLHIISDEDLHAYIDGALTEERAVAVRQALASDPELADRNDLAAALRKDLGCEVLELAVGEELIAGLFQRVAVLGANENGGGVVSPPPPPKERFPCGRGRCASAAFTRRLRPPTP